MELLLDIDFSYIFSHCNQSKFEIPFYYDRQNWKQGETYRVRISNIYDPSKFWIVLKEQELNLFQKYLTDFYSKYQSLYKICVNTVTKNMYCVVFTDSAYYRGLIVNVPHMNTLRKKAVVFLFDFGYTCTVNLEDLYYLSEKLYEIPRFAVRASLSCLQPYKEHIWNLEVVKRFNELVSKKVILCMLENTDPCRKIVEIRIGITTDELSNVQDIGKMLVGEKLAKSITAKEAVTKIPNNSRYTPKTKYPYLFPSFEAIESGFMPSSVYSSEMLRHCVARDVLFKPYFTYRGTL